MKDTLNNTKGKHGRRTFQQEEQSIDNILIADDKQALKEAILRLTRQTRGRDSTNQKKSYTFAPWTHKDF